MQGRQKERVKREIERGGGKEADSHTPTLSYIQEEGQRVRLENRYREERKETDRRGRTNMKDKKTDVGIKRDVHVIERTIGMKRKKTPQDLFCQKCWKLIGQQENCFWIIHDKQ